MEDTAYQREMKELQFKKKKKKVETLEREEKTNSEKGVYEISKGISRFKRNIYDTIAKLG